MVFIIARYLSFRSLLLSFRAMPSVIPSEAEESKAVQSVPSFSCED